MAENGMAGNSVAKNNDSSKNLGKWVRPLSYTVVTEIPQSNPRGAWAGDNLHPSHVCLQLRVQ